MQMASVNHVLAMNPILLSTEHHLILHAIEISYWLYNSHTSKPQDQEKK